MYIYLTISVSLSVYIEKETEKGRERGGEQENNIILLYPSGMNHFYVPSQDANISLNQQMWSWHLPTDRQIQILIRIPLLADRKVYLKQYIYIYIYRVAKKILPWQVICYFRGHQFQCSIIRTVEIIYYKNLCL